MLTAQQIKEIKKMENISNWDWKDIDSLTENMAADLLNLLIKDPLTCTESLTESLKHINKILNREVNKTEVRPLLLEVEKAIVEIKTRQTAKNKENDKA